MNETSTLTEKVEKLNRTKSALLWAILAAAAFILILLLIYGFGNVCEESNPMMLAGIVLAALIGVMAIMAAMMNIAASKHQREISQLRGKMGALVVNFQRAREFDQVKVSLGNEEGEPGSDDLYVFHQSETGMRKVAVSGVWRQDGKTYTGAGEVNISSDRVGSLTISLLDEPDGKTTKLVSGARDGGLTISLLDEPDRIKGGDTGLDDDTDDEFDGEKPTEPKNDWGADVDADSDNEVIE